MSQHEKIDYVEFPSRNLEITKKFFKEAFGWEFTDCGPDYTAFSNAGLRGGFFTSDQCVSAKAGSALVVLYSECIRVTETKVINAGGEILQPLFSFPGGCRFHFVDPNGNEYAVWSDTGCEGS